MKHQALTIPVLLSAVALGSCQPALADEVPSGPRYDTMPNGEKVDHCKIAGKIAKSAAYSANETNRDLELTKVYAEHDLPWKKDLELNASGEMLVEDTFDTARKHPGSVKPDEVQAEIQKACAKRPNPLVQYAGKYENLPDKKHKAQSSVDTSDMDRQQELEDAKREAKEEAKQEMKEDIWVETGVYVP